MNISVVNRDYVSHRGRGERGGRRFYISAAFAFLALWMLSPFFNFIAAAPKQATGMEYLERATRKFDAIKDYSADVKVHMELTAVQAPDMEAKVYYKAPDKVKIDSKGLFFMPKDVGVINPRKFSPDDFVVDILDTSSFDGKPAVRLSLIPKKDLTGEKGIILTIDRSDWLIVKIETAPYPGREASAKITYGKVDGFQVPVRVDVSLNVSGGDHAGEGGEFGHERRRAAQLNGKVVIYYSDYRINSGLSDDIFREDKSE